MNLNVSTLFFELAVIFLPGFIWMKIYTYYGAKGARSQFDMILNAFIFGVISYAILLAIYSVKGIPLNVLNIDSDSKKLLDPKILPEIIYAICIAIICGIISLYVENFKIFTLFVQWIGATKRFGDEDVWDFTFNSRSRGMGYVHFRDFERSVVYAGYVICFSESGELRELLLVNVIVYDFGGNKMYEVPRLYLARERHDVHIEFPS
jgi:Family of unknown function (DUF6338)